MSPKATTENSQLCVRNTSTASWSLTSTRSARSDNNLLSKSNKLIKSTRIFINLPSNSYRRRWPCAISRKLCSKEHYERNTRNRYVIAERKFYRNVREIRNMRECSSSKPIEQVNEEWQICLRFMIGLLSRSHIDDYALK